MDKMPCQHCKTRSRSLFHFCHIAELQEVSEEKHIRTYKKGQIIFHEGNLPTGLYCVNSGKVKLHTYGTDGKEQIIRLIRPGDLLGYRGLISETPFTASATALEESSVCFIPAKVFNDLMQFNPDFREGLMKLLAENLGEADKRLAGMAYKPVRERLAEALLLIESTYNPGGELPYMFQFSREDLASLVGTAKETVIRLLSEMKEEGHIRSEGRKIVILNKEGLHRIASMYD